MQRHRTEGTILGTSQNLTHSWNGFLRQFQTLIANIYALENNVFIFPRLIGHPCYQWSLILQSNIKCLSQAVSMIQRITVRRAYTTIIRQSIEIPNNPKEKCACSRIYNYFFSLLKLYHFLCRSRLNAK